MISKKVKVNNPSGFHVRPAGMFSAEMGKYASDIWVDYNGKQLDGKSIMSLLSAGIGCGQEVTVICQGEDEQEALQVAVELVESGLGES
jgi:phosphocarrier protein HPr